MTLQTGARLGPYQIVSHLGSGGMGEVYRARDARLNREVAIKVLPDLFARDPDRLVRFEREAQVLASINHPNIAQVYGVEGGALIMELVDGEDLSALISRGPVPIDEALPIAKQIADGLEAAHEQGIVHRDLKPGNIKVRADGRVKVLDFGLAVGRKSATPSNIANSPTFTSPVPLTDLGVILGTAAYMAPEQARGKAVDRRADVWAFGCVLFEMLSGAKPFDGETVTDVLAAIVSREPDWSRLPPSTPASVRSVLRWCLRKDPAERLKDLGDARLLLSAADAADRDVVPAAPFRPSSFRLAAAVAGWVAAVGLAVALVWMKWQAPQTQPPRAIRLELSLAPRLAAEHSQFTPGFALSPDGARLVYVARSGDTSALYLRDLETGDVRLLPDTEGAFAPAFSRDGGTVAFLDNERLRAVPLSSQLARVLAPAAAARTGRIAVDWTPSGELIFPEPGGLAKVSGHGGSPSIVAAQLSSQFMLVTPRALFDGRHVIVSVKPRSAIRTDDASQIAIVDTVTGEHRVIVEQGGSPQVLQIGTEATSPVFLLFARSGRLWAGKFDLSARTLGVPQPVVDNVEMRANGDGAQFALSSNGTLVYLEARRAELVWVSRDGTAAPMSSVLRRFAIPRLAPDGKTLAVEVQDQPHHVWRLDLIRDLLTPLTQGKEGRHNFAWSPDGGGIAFTASAGATSRAMWMPADGAAAAQELVPSSPEGDVWVEEWSRDGRWLLVTRTSKGASELQAVPLEPGAPPKVAGPPRTIVKLDAASANFSPDGQWIAWCDCAANSPPTSVFISRFHDGKRYQIATDNVSEPRWSPSGKELFFRRGTTMMAVDVTLGPDPRVGRPRALFEGEYLNWGAGNYDIAKDGRFVMVRPAAASAAGRALSIRLHWGEELKRLLN
jgi:hypothetical protein